MVGISLVVQWLRLHAPNAGGWGLMPGQRTRYHTLQLKIPNATAKTHHSQKIKYFFLKKEKNSDGSTLNVKRILNLKKKRAIVLTLLFQLNILHISQVSHIRKFPTEPLLQNQVPPAL